MRTARQVSKCQTKLLDPGTLQVFGRCELSPGHALRGSSSEQLARPCKRAGAHRGACSSHVPSVPFSSGHLQCPQIPYLFPRCPWGPAAAQQQANCLCPWELCRRASADPDIGSHGPDSATAFEMLLPPVSCSVAARPLSKNTVPSCGSARSQRNSLGLRDAVRNIDCIFLTVKKKKWKKKEILPAAPLPGLHLLKL